MRYSRENYLTTRDGAELWSCVLGQGEPTLVLCDGLGCDGFAWKRLIRELAPEHRIVRWHYRGHGHSGLARDPTRIGISYFADDLAQILADVGIRKATIVGHSMGTQVALELHRRHSEVVSGLVLVCGAYGHPLDTFHDDSTARIAFPYLLAAVERFPAVARAVTRFLIPTEAALQFARFTELNRQLVRREDFIPYLDHLARIDPRTFVRTLASAADHTAWDHLPKIGVPTLIVAGERDRFTPMWLSVRMQGAIPGSELLVVPSGTHTAPIELPELIALRMDRFFRDRGLFPPARPGKLEAVEDRPRAASA